MVTKILLAAIFNALSTTDYSVNTLIQVGFFYYADRVHVARLSAVYQPVRQ